jgi:hypothetical protein
VLFFNASTRIANFSQNAAFEMLASWAVRLAGVPVVQAVCRQGMQQCMLGTNRRNPAAPPPCRPCQALTSTLYPNGGAAPILPDVALAGEVTRELAGLSVTQMEGWQRDGLPYGELCVGTLRWALRRYHLGDDEPTRDLFRRYIASAVNLARRFEELMGRCKPRGIVVFNGITYPEAIARQVAMGRGIPVVTHEVGIRPLSAFFSHEHATFRAIDLPDGFALGPGEEKQLAEVLERRFQGQFSMAGVRFWPEMRPVPAWLADKMKRHRQTVVVFTNVVFDTSQAHANTIYPEMFAWLEDVRAVTTRHPETLFIVRAHPDETRPGKESQESVADWVRQTGVAAQENVVFLAPEARVSSYDLIRAAKFILVYNSSIGLEASILGAAVLSAGRARYTQKPTVFFPSDQQAYRQLLGQFLEAAALEAPGEFASWARRVFYYEFFKASLGFEAFLQNDPHAPGEVILKAFEPQDLEHSTEISVLQQGILHGESFVLP